jgi:hypothetical protein
MKHQVQRILTANITSYGSLEHCAPLLVSQNRIVFIQEHHLLGTKLQNAMTQLARSGVKAWLAEALPTAKLGTSGGVGLLWGPGTHLLGHHRALVTGRAMAAVLSMPRMEPIICHGVR